MADRPSDIIPAIADDGSFYQIDKLEAHQRGVMHLAVSVFVFSGPELLIQRRAAGKYHSGLLWANTCCSHPHWDELPAAAAHRRLREELGCELDLTPTSVLDYASQVTDGLFENERVHVFRGHADKLNFILTPNPVEVASTRWIALPTLKNEMQQAPHDFAPWFRIYLDRWSELGLG